LSKQNIELHRRALEAFNARDVEAFIAYVDPSSEYYPVLATLDGVTVYHGHDGVRSWFADFQDVWGEIRVEPEAYFDLGELTILSYVLRARGRQSDVEVTMQFTQVAKWRDNLMVYVKVYTSREEALADLGASEDELEPIAP
jgi:ketosteroid isomerase-like protein